MEKEKLFTLVTGCMLFGEEQGSDYPVTVLEVEGVSLHTSEDVAGEAGEDYLSDGGDSYFVLEMEESIHWTENTKEVFERYLSNAIKEFESSKNQQP